MGAIDGRLLEGAIMGEREAQAYAAGRLSAQAELDGAARGPVARREEAEARTAQAEAKIAEARLADMERRATQPEDDRVSEWDKRALREADEKSASTLSTLAINLQTSGVSTEATDLARKALVVALKRLEGANE